MQEKNRVILGIDNENSGTFEHSFEFARNMVQRDFKVEYYSHWFGGPIERLNLVDGQKEGNSLDSLPSDNGIFYLQSHTWEHDGLLNKIHLNGGKIVFNLHAVIPYFYLHPDLKKSFLDGTLDDNEISHVIKDVMSDRERSQLRAIDRADYLITISENHKLALKRLGVKKRVEVFENISDTVDIGEDILSEAKEKSIQYRNQLGSENNILFCGRLDRSKGGNGLFRAFDIIRESYPSSKLLLLGAEKSMIEEISEGINFKSYANLVSLPWIDKRDKQGFNDFLKYHLASDVIIQPMITPNLYSKTVLDAMGLEIPVISSVSDYTIGSSGNYAQIVDSFEFLKRNPEKVRKIVNQAKNKVKMENTWDSYIGKLESILKE